MFSGSGSALCSQHTCTGPLQTLTATLSRALQHEARCLKEINLLGKLTGQLVPPLLFADDLCLTSLSMQGLQKHRTLYKPSAMIEA